MAKGNNVSVFRQIEEIEANKKAWLSEYLDYSAMQKNINFSQKAIEAMILFSQSLEKVNFGEYSRIELIDIYNKYIRLFRDIFIAYNMSQPEVSEPLENYLKQLLLKHYQAEENTKVFLIITSPTAQNLLIEENLDWQKILLKAFTLPKNQTESINNKIENHSRKYGWIATQEQNKFLDSKYYLKILQENLKSDSIDDIKDRINNLQFQGQKTKSEQEKILAKLKSQEIKNIAETMQKMASLRIGLRLAWTRGAYFSQPLFDEIAKRLKIEPNLARCMQPKELQNALIKKQFTQKQIEDREKNYIYFLKNGRKLLLTGQKAEEFIGSQEFEKTNDDFNELKGVIANPGFASGEVKIIHSHSKSQSKEVQKMKKGQILVTGSTKPQLMVACRKAIAIVTDEGGMLSHAAIVSRELNIPCIVGTKNATQVLKDGDLVEVDAKNGIVKILKRS